MAIRIVISQYRNWKQNTTLKTLGFTEFHVFFEQQMSNYSSDFDIVELQVSNKKERQNEDKIKFSYLFFVTVFFCFLPWFEFLNLLRICSNFNTMSNWVFEQLSICQTSKHHLIKPTIPFYTSLCRQRDTKSYKHQLQKFNFCIFTLSENLYQSILV